MYKILGGDGKEYGPIAADVVRLWVNEGRANAQTMVLLEGGSSWVALGQVPEFAILFSVPAAIAPVSTSLVPVNHPFALTGFILSLVSITLGLCCCYGFPFNICGIVFSAIGLMQMRKEPGRYSGRGLAIAGIVIGIVSIIVAVLLLVLGVALSWNDIKKDFNSL